VALHHAPYTFKDIPLTSLANILHRYIQSSFQSQLTELLTDKLIGYTKKEMKKKREREREREGKKKMMPAKKNE